MNRFHAVAFRVGLGLMMLMLSACVSSTVSVRPITSEGVVSIPVESRQAEASSFKQSALPEAVMQEPLIRVNCRASLSKDDELVKALVDQRIRDGNYYAALAQVQALPSEVASVAVLRADILRQLQSPQAESWYVALQGGCMAGRAEHGLGLIAAQRDDLTQALRRLSNAARLLPSDSRVRNDLGFLYLHLGMDAQAEFELRTAYELASNDKIPGFNLALLALLRQDAKAFSYWAEQGAFNAEDRDELLHSCQYLMRKRKRSQDSVACPINPRSSVMVPTRSSVAPVAK